LRGISRSRVVNLELGESAQSSEFAVDSPPRDLNYGDDLRLRMRRRSCCRLRHGLTIAAFEVNGSRISTSRLARGFESA
jgi:hypothetical protein